MRHVRMVLMLELLLLLLLVLAASSAAHAEHLTADVIIVGAGMCGITAGRTLSEKGITNFFILEATDRIGGRMRTQEFAGITIELGANWVEGVNGNEVNPIWTLANEVKLRTFTSDFNNLTENIYDTTGLLPPQTGPGNFTTDENNYVADLGTSLTTNGEADISVLTAQRLYGRVPSTPVEMCLEYQLYDGEYAEPPRVTSLKKTWPNPTFANFGPDLEFVADQRGFVVVTEPIATYLESKNGTITDSRLKFHKVVNKIMYSKTGVTLFTEDGSTYSAKIAICTVSVGVLQSNLIKFVPDLPFWKIEAVFQYDMAIYTKIFLKFPKRFWPTGASTEYFLYADDTRGYYPIWQHLDREFPDEHIIFVTITDTESKRVEQQSDNKTQTEVMMVLRSMFGDTIPEPIAILVPRWWENRFFRGSFTNWPLGIDAPVFGEIRAPIDNLYFAGEHTSDLYNGYVHGAYLEGITVGRKVAGCLQKNVCVSGSTKKKKRKNEKNFMESACGGPIKEELDIQRRHWSQKFSSLEDALNSKCSSSSWRDDTFP